MDNTQFNRLPKYARDEITRLTSKNTILQGRLDQFNGDKASPITVSGPGGVTDFTPIPNGTVRFRLAEDLKEWSSHIDVRVTESGELDINGGRAVDLHPGASNHLTITLRR